MSFLSPAPPQLHSTAAHATSVARTRRRGGLRRRHLPSPPSLMLPACARVAAAPCARLKLRRRRRRIASFRMRAAAVVRVFCEEKRGMRLGLGFQLFCITSGAMSTVGSDQTVVVSRPARSNGPRVFSGRPIRSNDGRESRAGDRDLGRKRACGPHKFFMGRACFLGPVTEVLLKKAHEQWFFFLFQCIFL